MKLVITAVPVVIGRFTLPLPGRGAVRHVAFENKQTLVMARGKPEFEEVPVLFIEAEPGGPVRTRRFEVVRHGTVLELEDGEVANWCATNISGKGLVVHVFELEDTAS